MSSTGLALALFIVSQWTWVGVLALLIVVNQVRRLRANRSVEATTNILKIGGSVSSFYSCLLVWAAIAGVVELDELRNKALFLFCGTSFVAVHAIGQAIKAVKDIGDDDDDNEDDDDSK